MQVRENLAMDAAGTTFTSRKTYTISRFTLIFLTAISLCTIIAAGLLIYNFATCPEIQVQSQVCESNHVIPLTHISGSNVVKPSVSNNLNTSNTTITQTASHENLTDLRLPESIVPISYEIKLIPFLFENNFTFSGDVKIIVKVVKKCQNITLHAMALKIKSNDVTVRLINDTKNANGTLNPHAYAAIKRVYAVEPKQFFIIEFNHTLNEDDLYEIHIKYVGILNDQLQGFYRSAYTIGNETRWVAATQFQPTDARRAVPCFDEPALKAKFKLTLARLRNMTTLSNMPLNNSTPVAGLPGYFWDEFQESVPMSTYLLAFVVMDFEHRTSGQFRVWTRADAIHSAAYSLDIGPKILSFYEQFFNIPYPLPKVDMISLPDFTAGAMENWGLITFREAAMLYEEGVSARINKQRVSTVVAHELAHQWFGNLVTPSWWSDLWLNEGFATYMEYVGIDAVEPSWKSMDQFVLNEVQAVFTLDALSTSHKIWIEVRNPDEINEIFDRISYGKGAAIIRMMYHFLTAQVFKDGLSSFLREKAYKAADQNDLWFHLTQKARLNQIFDNETSVKEIMDTWTLQTGFPEVNVTRNYETKEVVFNQKRFVYVTSNKRKKGNLPEKNNENPLWWVPLSYTTSKALNFNATQPVNWIRKTEKLAIKNIDIEPDEWLLVNIQQTAYYRVNYDRQNWKLLSKYLQDPKLFTNIAPANRAQLIDDALNLARGGSLDYQTALDMTKYLIHENDYVPWKAAINSLNFIDSMFMKSGEYYKMKKYFIYLIDHVYKDVRFLDPPEPDMLRGYKRVDILTAACHLGYQDCVENSVRNFGTWMLEPNPDNINPISPNLRQIVYCTAIKYGDQKEWDFAWERFQRTIVSSEKEILLSALGCSREAWILTRYLERSLTDEYGIRKHDLFRVFAAVSSNVLGQPIAFNFIRSNWKAMKEYLGPSFSNLHSIVKYSARRINNGFELGEFKHFTEHIKESGRTIHQAIETAEANIEWMNKNYKTIVDWLTKVQYDS